MKTYWLKDNPENSVYLECGCRNADHLLIMSYDTYDDEDFDDLFVYHGMNHYLSFWKRLLVGVKYILGIKNKRFHFVETVLGEEEARKMFEFTRKYLKELKRSNDGKSRD